MNTRVLKEIQKFRSENGFDMLLDVKEDTTLSSCGLDSLDRLSLVQSLEKTFGIDIDDFEIQGDTTVGQLCYIVSRLEDKNEYVDLGLTSGTLWAKKNVELDGKKLFTFDEAIEKFGDTMPTAAQIVELATECAHEWTKEDGVAGMRFIGPNRNSIFFPADGYTWKGGKVEYAGSEGNVWSKTPSVNSSAAYAYYLNFYAGYVYPLNLNSRAIGFSVRPVRE